MVENTAAGNTAGGNKVEIGENKVNRRKEKAKESSKKWRNKPENKEKMKKYQKKYNEDIKNNTEKREERNRKASDWRKKNKDKKNKITIDDYEVSPMNI